MEQEFDVKTYLSILRRRYLYLVLPIIPLFAIACAVAYLIPPVYHASAKILVQSQQIPTDLARSTVTTNASQQIEVIRQRLMTRTNLLQIARKYNLYQAGARSSSLSDIVEFMRSSTQIEQIAVGTRRSRRGQEAIAFSVSFDYGTPTGASSVANEFVALILEQNIKTRTTRAAETHRFFEKQVKRLDKELAAQEALIVEFKRDNEAALPENLGYRRVLLTRLQSELSEIDRDIGSLEADRDNLLQTTSGSVTAQQVSTTDAEIAKLKLQLTQLRAVYSERHPSVRKAKNRLAALEKTAVAGPAEPAQPAASGGSQGGAPTADARGSIRTQAIDRKVLAQRDRRSTVQKKISDIEETVLKTPQVQVALRTLTRKYEALQEQQRRAQAKVAEAATGELLEEGRQAERFEVIERATAPSGPIKPNRPLVMLAGFVFSVAAGVGVVLLVELLDGSIRSGMDLERRLQIRPLATIPLVTTAEERTRSRRSKWKLLLLTAVLAGTALGLVHVLYQPLDLVLQTLRLKVGI